MVNTRHDILHDDAKNLFLRWPGTLNEPTGGAGANAVFFSKMGFQSGHGRVGGGGFFHFSSSAQQGKVKKKRWGHLQLNYQVPKMREAAAL